MVLTLEEAVVKKATAEDVKGIHDLIAFYFRDSNTSIPEEERGTLLYRSLNKIREHLDDYFVIKDENGSLIGCVGLWNDTANGNFEEYLHKEGAKSGELISLAVVYNREYRSHGYGVKLVEAVMHEAVSRDLDYVYALVNPAQIRFFENRGFRLVGNGVPSEKMKKECTGCPRNELSSRWDPDYTCNEHPMLMTNDQVLERYGLARI